MVIVSMAMQIEERGRRGTYLGGCLLAPSLCLEAHRGELMVEMCNCVVSSGTIEE